MQGWWFPYAKVQYGYASPAEMSGRGGGAQVGQEAAALPELWVLSTTIGTPHQQGPKVHLPRFRSFCEAKHQLEE